MDSSIFYTESIVKCWYSQQRLKYYWTPASSSIYSSLQRTLSPLRMFTIQIAIESSRREPDSSPSFFPPNGTAHFQDSRHAAQQLQLTHSITYHRLSKSSVTPHYLGLPIDIAQITQCRGFGVDSMRLPLILQFIMLCYRTVFRCKTKSMSF